MSRTRTRRPPRLRRAGDFAALALVGAHAGPLLLMWRDGAMPDWLSAAFVLLSMAAFIACVRDKRAAQRETTLHLPELAGGWPTSSRSGPPGAARGRAPAPVAAAAADGVGLNVLARARTGGDDGAPYSAGHAPRYAA